MNITNLLALAREYKVCVLDQSNYCAEMIDDAIDDPDYVDLQEIIDELEALCTNVRESIENLENIRDENE